MRYEEKHFSFIKFRAVVAAERNTRMKRTKRMMRMRRMIREKTWMTV
jgi:hypothetical protein